MLIIDHDSPVPLTNQILSGIRYAIASGEVRPGDALPAVRQLAHDLGVNLNTVARAYRILESEGLARPARGRGTVVMADSRRSVEDEETTRFRVRSALGAALAEARLAGLSLEVISEMFRAHLEALWRGEIDRKEAET